MSGVLPWSDTLAGRLDEHVIDDDGHRGIDYRHPLALAWLCHRITDRIH